MRAALLRLPALLAAPLLHPTASPMIVRRFASGAALPAARSSNATAWRAAAAPSLSLAGRRRALAVSASSSSSAAGTQTPATPQHHQHQRRNVIATLRSRGLVQDVTGDDLERDALQGAPLTVYCGFDPTADSLHLGNLLGVVVLAWFLRCGHRPLALLGGATARVGDPSGRQTERPVLSEAEIEANGAAIGRTLADILRRAAAEAQAEREREGGGAAASSSSPPAVAEVRVLNNLDWFGPMSLLTFLREVGKHARVGTMLAKDSVKSRMAAASAAGDSSDGGASPTTSNSNSGGGLSFTEFTYQLLQGYDYVHLARHEGVRVQVGGSDQWGNITAGTDLIRRLGAATTTTGGSGNSNDGDENPPSVAYHGLTFPLLVDAEGRKVGKSTATGAVWLSAARLSPYKFYQALFATADADVGRFLRMLTFLPLDEVASIEASMREPTTYVPNTAQRRLAEEVTRFVHGEEGLAQALRATEALRPGAAKKAGSGDGGDPAAAALDAETLEAIASDAPTAEIARADLVGKPLVDAVVRSGLLKTKGEARRMAKNGGLYVNNAKVGGEDDVVVREEDLIDGRVLLLAAGKKNKMLVRVV